jgi:hypothetical protein
MIFRHGMSVAEGKAGRKIMIFEITSIISRCGEPTDTGNGQSHRMPQPGEASAIRQFSVGKAALQTCVA